MGVDISLGIRKTAVSGGGCKQLENMYPIQNGKLLLSFGRMLLCENASPGGPELLTLRESGNSHFQVKFLMLNVGHRIKENMLNLFVKSTLNIGVPHSCVLAPWLSLYILSLYWLNYSHDFNSHQGTEAPHLPVWSLL